MSSAPDPRIQAVIDGFYAGIQYGPDTDPFAYIGSDVGDDEFHLDGRIDLREIAPYILAALDAIPESAT